MSRVDPQVASGYHRMHGSTILKMLGDDAEVAEMVTWHEISHAGLNATTTYGLLLQRVGWDSHLDIDHPRIAGHCLFPATLGVHGRWGKKWGKKPHRLQPIPADLDLAKTA